MKQLLDALRALAEPTRLRLAVVLSYGERTVSELTEILGQSQPRLSRHLKLMVEAGVLTRQPEGAWVFFRLSGDGVGAKLHRAVMTLAEDDVQTRADLVRVEILKRRQAAAANEWFHQHAQSWDELRERFISEPAEAEVLAKVVGGKSIDLHIDLGTGTGTMLELLAPLSKAAIGIDMSREMLRVARARLGAPGLAHCQVRQGDLLRLELVDGSADLVSLHHVLHFLDDPSAAIREAVRTLRPAGRLLIVDFAPHSLEALRTTYFHRYLGFDHADIAAWCKAAGLDRLTQHPVTDESRPDALDTRIWCATRLAGGPDVRHLDAA
ncbi:MAG: metalloregulator ArsR/SmtB family transcription factor [Chromatiales bacterium]|jgi:ubiquinone/menaquinone biosynthesis C-methylase UbiE/DNA-binding transcriptional ArsR family regulator|nr:metalloregulator ArsR/SmtB family transcription factor [Chromatiales bacterium]